MRRLLALVVTTVLVAGCGGDEERPQAEATLDDAHVTDITRLRVAQSIFYAVTEICKGKPASYHPGNEAVEGVRSRKYRVRPRP
jgi:hypothetical protein